MLLCASLADLWDRSLSWDKFTRGWRKLQCYNLQQLQFWVLESQPAWGNFVCRGVLVPARCILHNCPATATATGPKYTSRCDVFGKIDTISIKAEVCRASATTEMWKAAFYPSLLCCTAFPVKKEVEPFGLQAVRPGKEEMSIVGAWTSHCLTLAISWCSLFYFTAE